MTEATRRTLLASTLAATALAGSGAPARAAEAVPGGAQAPGFYRYRVGDVRVTAVTDGANTLPLPERFVLNADRAAVSAALTADFRDGANLTVPFTPLVIETGGRRVVIDTGNGEAAFQKSGGAVGQFHANLKAAGFDRGAIDAVVISHFHGDHVNGLLNPAGKPAFPNAEIHVPEAEWAYWMDDGAMSRAPAGRMQDQFRNVRRVFDGLDRKVTPYAWEREVLPGLTALGTPGHTPGHTSFLLASGSDSLFVQSDVTNVPVLFARHPGWHVMYDQDPAMAEATRRRVYDRIAAERTLLQGFHYPFPAAAHLERTADGYREVLVPWDPVPR
ncbi:MBL fold metallo-hydrolase [Methylobacterium sp.]|jgi:glyoxylase-like metal-dependent hydrolase (beta-lactamase superfamily II)|uniref:MBL fold metallo-hydrolase n=1 Tax=Methylobacterium sp. TaxID=409 RepID=UPI0025FA21D8|nr:MBL fold metallo-hydrolase [Methylobacterium sp.]MBY0256774.1 MBL fold metallo-hydrolase [Methylobacterium sp.]